MGYDHYRRGLELALHQCGRVLDTLDTAHFADDYLGELKKAFRLGGSDGVPLPEDDVDISNPGGGANLGEGARFQPRDELDKNIALDHLLVLYSVTARLASPPNVILTWIALERIIYSLMRYIKVGCFLILLFALLVLLFPLPAQAIPKFIDLMPAKGRIGDWIGFKVYHPDVTKLVDIYFSSDEVEVNNTIGGMVTAYQFVGQARTLATSVIAALDFFIVPEGLTDGVDKEEVHNGDYYVYVTYHSEKRIICLAKFTVTSGEIVIDPEEGAVGDEVEVNGEGFRPNQRISVEYDGAEVDIISGASETNSQGNFLGSIIVPASVTGDHTITVSDKSGDWDEVEFTVEPKLALDPGEQGIGGVVVVNGTGFSENEALKLSVGNLKIDPITGSLATDGLGSFNCSFLVPFFDSCGPRNIGIDDSEGTRLFNTQLVVLAGITLSQTSPASPGYVGMGVVVRGIGFTSGADVSISYAINDDETITVATAKADENGKLSAGFDAPPSAAGSHVVTATDGVITGTSIFTMESKAPPFPRLLLPEIGSKSEAKAYFDWDDVTDPSGVSYTLQVGTDDSFATIVLEKMGLLQSEYAMSGGEKLAPTKAKAPYCWRVKAVDGASNEGDWSPSGLFYVGSSWLSNWMLYVFCGLGVALLVSGIFWLRSRRPRYSPPQYPQ